MSIQAIILAAQARLAQTMPDLETNAVLRLDPVEVRTLDELLNKTLGPALLEMATKAEDAERQHVALTQAQIVASICDKLDAAREVVLADIRAAKLKSQDEEQDVGGRKAA